MSVVGGPARGWTDLWANPMARFGVLRAIGGSDRGTQMQKKMTNPNVSQLIREFLDRAPDGKPAEIVDWLLEEHGLEVSPQYISTIKSNTKRRVFGKYSDDPVMRRLMEAKEFISRMGGAEEAVKAIQDYQSLTQG